MRRITIAKSTLEILEIGSYISPNGHQVHIHQELQSCLDSTKCYSPENLCKIESEVFKSLPPFSDTEFEVRNETTLMGSERIAKSGKLPQIGVLNFASAKNPGGGFLKGAQAQEESLARSSALYKSLLKCREYYDFHRSERSLLYSNWMIYSPSCPVFKNDDGELLEQPYFVNFITSPAPNAGMIQKNQQHLSLQIPEVLMSRALKVLSLAAEHGCDTLILGAWGCGVFKNDPAIVAQIFADILLPGGQFWGRFQRVIFSVLDNSKQQQTFAEFDKRFNR
ncbi:TIGR02452 family protein [Nostoc sp. FACHB-87]|uniref:TIGR02452 family protein n=1 Tax=Nostocales TaxID=1161 RepID=UPI001688F2BC|nr:MULTISPECIES: TIGR02452 family protein [Nostocales]MBD2457405.1 TIGR02452 family protein [Nostoc sp. FACHB-87]MBD2476635.1 TIGR02452 family protein [Anabaena sp. FACHB-83]MBD2486434.1 TIGR02452 family protein [Aulosira sp. FACHB-615]